MRIIKHQKRVRQLYIRQSRYRNELCVWLLVVPFRVWIRSCRLEPRRKYLELTRGAKPSYENALVLREVLV